MRTPFLFFRRPNGRQWEFRTDKADAKNMQTIAKLLEQIVFTGLWPLWPPPSYESLLFCKAQAIWARYERRWPRHKPTDHLLQTLMFCSPRRPVATGVRMSYSLVGPVAPRLEALDRRPTVRVGASQNLRQPTCRAGAVQKLLARLLRRLLLYANVCCCLASLCLLPMPVFSVCVNVIMVRPWRARALCALLCSCTSGCRGSSPAPPPSRTVPPGSSLLSTVRRTGCRPWVSGPGIRVLSPPARFPKRTLRMSICPP